MSDRSKIEWTHATWNPVTGCTKVSPGCKHCYAETFSERFRGTPGHHFEHGFDLTFRPDRLDEPLRWKRPRRVFVCSMSDLFHEKIPAAYVHEVFRIMRACPRHTFQVLTKRPQNMAIFAHAMRAEGLLWPDNVWAGTSIERDDYVMPRVPWLLSCGSRIAFVSAEPLLGPVPELKRWLGPSLVNWLIVGGESGSDARPFRVEWAHRLVAECHLARIPCFVKQLGANVTAPDGSARYRLPLRDRKGGNPAEWAEDLRVREWPDHPAAKTPGPVASPARDTLHSDPGQ